MAVQLRATLLLALLAVVGCAHHVAGRRSAAPKAVPVPAGTARGGQAADETAFVHVNLVPMDREQVLADRTVVVRAGRIVAEGPAATTLVQAGARVIDGAGRYLMPGLADMHTHVWDPGHLVLLLANGVTTARNMWGDGDVNGWRDLIAAGKILGPTLVTPGPVLEGNPPNWPSALVLDTPEEAEAEVRAEKAAGYDFVKVYNTLSPEVFAALAAAARKEGILFAGHVPYAVGLRAAIAAGQASTEHLYGVEQLLQAPDSPYAEVRNSPDRHRAWEHVAEARFAPVAAELAAVGAWLCPTLVVLDRWVPDSEVERFRQEPAMKYVPLGDRAGWDLPAISGTAAPSVEIPLIVQRGMARRLRFVGALQRAGANLLLGTDAANPWVVWGFAVHEELRLLVRAGLTPYEALRTATSNPARFLGKPQEFGTVAVGARADLLLLDGNPLANVGNAARIHGVMARGRYYPAETIRMWLDTLARGNEALRP